jgi:hypothetical protein
MNDFAGDSSPMPMNSPENNMASQNDMPNLGPRDGLNLNEVTLNVRQTSHSQLASHNAIGPPRPLYDADLQAKTKSKNTKKVFKGRQRTTKCFQWMMIDWFGDGISFNVDGEDGVKTTLGCLCTVLAVSMVAFISFWFVSTWASRENIYWNGFTNRLDDFPAKNFTQAGYNFSLIFSDRNSGTLAPSDALQYLSAEAYHIHETATIDSLGDRTVSSSVTTQIPLVTCSADSTTLENFKVGDYKVIGNLNRVFGPKALCPEKSETVD